MASKTIAWADQSGDVITMTAPAWSGSQTVTLSTPENFGIARELNIVFYSESNPAVSATLNVKQAEATLALSETSLVFASNDTSEKTVTVTTNMSTLDGAQLTLEGDAASDFTLSELSALSNGRATFTIKPNSANESQDPRNVTIKLTAGRLATRSLPVTQDADSVQSVTYSNYKLAFSSGTIAGAAISASTIIPASGAQIEVNAVVTRDKTTLYTSGRSETVNEVLPKGESLVVSLYVTNGVPPVRYAFHGQRFTVGDSGTVAMSGEFQSLGLILTDEMTAPLHYVLSDLSSEGDLTEFSLSCQENKRESYSNYSSVDFSGKQITSDAQDVTLTATARGRCTYSSGATRLENVPIKFSVTMFLWATISEQTPGPAGIITSPSSCVISASKNTVTSNRSATVSIYPRLEDGSTGGAVIGTATLTQEAATPDYGTLTLKGIFSSLQSGAFDVSAILSGGRVSTDSFATLDASKRTITCTNTFVTSLVRDKDNLQVSNNIQVKSITLPVITFTGTINKITIGLLSAGTDTSVNLTQS